MKNIFKILVVAAVAVTMMACQKQRVVITGTVTEIDMYGQLIPSFTPEQIEAQGVTYGDLLEVRIGDDIVVTTPYVDAFTQAGSMSPCLCNYNRGGDFGLGIANGSFWNHIGGQVGDTIIVRLKAQEGYLKEYNLLQGTYTFERADYASDEVFANFREIRTTGVKAGVLYRSTSPISTTKNKVRFAYTAALCEKAGIQTIIDIADSEAKIAEFIAAPENKDSYMQACYQKGNIIGLGSNADYIDTVYMHKLAKGLRAMILHPAPYLIHCNEGKDRTGFYCLLLEALCGATVDEMKEDYMQTFVNLYHQEKGSEQYELTWKKNGYRMLYMIAHPDTWGKIQAVDWDKSELENKDYSAEAAAYIRMAGLTEEEMEDLRLKIAD